MHALTDNFRRFFRTINPSANYEQQAAREHLSITGLIEDPRGPASALSPTCFLQGSYKQDTAIYTINDVDIVALCDLSHPGSGGLGTRSWTRDEIFDTIAAPLLADGRYRDKVRYHAESMCIKVDLGIKIEILPVVFWAPNHPDSDKEPFRLYRPGKGQWEDGYAREHQARMSAKNKRTGGNFIPMVKVFKHLREEFNLDTVSFHIECLLYSLPDDLFNGGYADSIAATLSQIAAESADVWYRKRVLTPCGERDIFVSSEWSQDSWQAFHKMVVACSKVADIAVRAGQRDTAVSAWQAVLGKEFFPAYITTPA